MELTFGVGPRAGKVFAPIRGPNAPETTLGRAPLLALFLGQAEQQLVRIHEASVQVLLVRTLILDKFCNVIVDRQVICNAHITLNNCAIFAADADKPIILHQRQQPQLLLTLGHALVLYVLLLMIVSHPKRVCFTVLVLPTQYALAQEQLRLGQARRVQLPLPAVVVAMRGPK